MAPADYVSAMNAFLAALPQFVNDANSLAANMNSVAAGGAYALPFKFSTSTTVGAPASGYLSADNAAFGSVANLSISANTAAGNACTSWLNSMGESTSTVKGTIRLSSVDGSRYVLFRVLSVTNNNGWFDIGVSFISASATLYFSANEMFVMFFQRTGDVGSAGTGSLQLLAQTTVGAQVASIDYFNVFTSAYDTYVIEVEGLVVTAQGNLLMYMCKAGSLDLTAVYTAPVADGGAYTNGQTSFTFPVVIPTAGTLALAGTFRVLNVNSTTTSKVVSLVGSSNGTTCAKAGAYTGSNAVSGFRLAPASGAFTNGTVRIYGLKNS
jgi:hypothetical protein